MEKISFENIQQTRLLDAKVAERVKMFIPFFHFFDHQIVGPNSNLPSRENGGVNMGTTHLKSKVKDLDVRKLKTVTVELKKIK